MKKKEEIQEMFDYLVKRAVSLKLERTALEIRALSLTIEILCDIRSNMVGIMKAITPQSQTENDRVLRDVTETEP